ncbi:hypothetical protein TRAPUB_6064 [Trametes pubescens]|uniref:MYND-type domain-containing protein n=1 Tax=Trametes pubescens TaxID=154538 RepID=A0A1M2V719_TRAPU|nr:hypothetical protein TRAPUB_6064 [Trametes pubescens]
MNSQGRAMPSTTIPSRNAPSCTHCGNEGSPLVKLKRCKGCSIATYRGKECQKNGWSAHRYTPYGGTILLHVINVCHSSRRGRDNSRRQCRPNNNSSKPEDTFDTNRLAGYPALIVLNVAVTEWSGVHQMARTIIGSVAIHLDGSFDFSNPVASEKVLIFYLTSMKNRGEENPARAFRVSSPSLAPQSELGPFAQRYKAGMVESAKQEHEYMRTLLPVTMDPSFSSMLPSVSLMAHTGLFFTSNCHISRMNHHRIAGERWRAVIQDISAMCMSAMNAGYVLRPGPAVDVPPEVGALVRRKKK